MTYPQPAVAQCIADNVVPLRISADHPELGPKFNVKWTPTLVFLDPDGVEHYRSLGFVSAEEFPPLVLLGVAKGHFNRAERPKALECLNRLVESYPHSFSAPEAIYLRGVAGYIETHDVANLIAIHDTLSAQDPGSDWAMRSAPYRLLKK